MNDTLKNSMVSTGRVEYKVRIEPDLKVSEEELTKHIPSLQETLSDDRIRSIPKNNCKWYIDFIHMDYETILRQMVFKKVSSSSNKNKYELIVICHFQ